MQNASPKSILNTSLPAQFRQIRIELAREPGHPEGDAGVAYVIIAPLDADDRIDPTLWRSTVRHVGSRDCGRTGRTTTVISFIVRAAAGHSTTIPAPTCRTRSDFTSPTNISHPANTFRSTSAVKCTPTASGPSIACSEGKVKCVSFLDPYCCSP
jgi:hypothetical protein